VRIDFHSPQTIYHTFFYSRSGFLQRSDDGGLSWASKTNGIDTSNPAGFYPPFIMDPSNAARLLVGTDRVYETTDRADDWTPISTPNANGWVGNGNIDCLAVAPSDGNMIYAAADGNIFVTTNDGGSWTQRNIPGDLHIADIAIDPSNSQIAYAVRDRFGASHVFRTTNGGMTWSDISGNLPHLPVYTIALASGSLDVGNDDGVYCSTDLGASWNRLGDGLPHVQVRELVLNRTLGILAAGTHGRGLWELSTGGVATNFSIVAAANMVSAGSSFPVTITALDDQNSVATGYTGTIHFTSTDGGANLPDDYTFTTADAGAHTFVVILIQAGSQTITVTDSLVPLGGSITLTVNPAAADHFSISVPAGTTAGSIFDVTVLALDPFNNIDANYQGTVHFTTTDQGSGVLLPMDTTFTAADAGVHTFQSGATLVTAGSQTVTATDTISGITGTGTIGVVAGSPDHVLVAAPAIVVSGMSFDVTVTIQDAFNNTVSTYLGTVQFMSSDNDPGVVLPSDYLFTGNDAGSHLFAGGTILITVGIQTIIVNDPSTGISGEVLINVVSSGAPPGGGGGNGPDDNLAADLIGIFRPSILPARPFALLTATVSRPAAPGLPSANPDGRGITSLFEARPVEERTVVPPGQSKRVVANGGQVGRSLLKESGLNGLEETPSAASPGD
jgi:photosystem II stability/assembly factor-like uncharacterized protein